MNMMNAKEFCEATNWNLRTIRQLCRENKLPHWRRGRVYLLNKEEAEKELERMKFGELPTKRQNRKGMTALANFRKELENEWKEER